MPTTEEAVRQAADKCGEEIQRWIDNRSVVAFNVKEIVGRHMASIVRTEVRDYRLGRDQFQASYEETQRRLTDVSYFCQALTCFSCGKPWSIEEMKEPCPQAHREHWSHEWVQPRVKQLTKDLLEARKEVERLNRELAEAALTIAMLGPEVERLKTAAEHERDHLASVVEAAESRAAAAEKCNEHWRNSSRIWHRCRNGVVRPYEAALCSCCLPDPNEAPDAKDFKAIDAFAAAERRASEAFSIGIEHQRRAVAAEQRVEALQFLLKPWSDKSGECWQCHCQRRGMQHTNGACRCSAEWKAKLAALSAPTPKQIWTAWGLADSPKPNTFHRGEGPAVFADGSLDPDCQKLFWRIEATDYNDAQRQYHELQGWEPYKPFDEPPQSEASEYAADTPISKAVRRICQCAAETIGRTFGMADEITLSVIVHDAIQESKAEPSEAEWKPVPKPPINQGVADLIANYASQKQRVKELEAELARVKEVAAFRIQEAEQLHERVSVLTASITSVVTQRLDHLCWIDVYRDLAKLVGVEFDPLLLPPETFLENCGRFHASLSSGCKYQPDAVTKRVAELEKQLAQARSVQSQQDKKIRNLREAVNGKEKVLKRRSEKLRECLARLKAINGDRDEFRGLIAEKDQEIAGLRRESEAYFRQAAKNCQQWVAAKNEAAALRAALPTVPHPGGPLEKVVAHYADGSTQAIDGAVVVQAILKYPPEPLVTVRDRQPGEACRIGDAVEPAPDLSSQVVVVDQSCGAQRQKRWISWDEAKEMIRKIKAKRAKSFEIKLDPVCAPAGMDFGPLAASPEEIQAEQAVQDVMAERIRADVEELGRKIVGEPLYGFLDHPLYKKAPAIRALKRHSHPTDEHLRACIMELCRMVEPLIKPKRSSPEEWFTTKAPQVERIKEAVAKLDPHWETHDDEDGVMVRVRWSEPDEQGRYLWVGHYPANMRHSAERRAERFNEEKRMPCEFDRPIPF